MKKKYICIILFISLVANIYQFMQPRYNKSSKTSVVSSTVTCPVTDNFVDSNNSDDSIGSLSDTFMSNPVDQYFLDKLTNSEDVIQYEITENAYLKAWKGENEKILKMLKKKCIYSEDKDIYTKYNDSIEEIYDNLESALIPIMLNNFNITPDSPSKNSYGQGTRDRLMMYRGMVYRNSCTVFIPYLEEYTFPTTDDLDMIVEETRQES